MEWESEDEKGDYRIAEKTGWMKIENREKHLEDRAGVYVLADAARHVKYIGKAGPGRLAKEVNNAIEYRKKGKGAMIVKALYTNSDDYAWDLEGDLKEKYDPPNNE